MDNKYMDIFNSINDNRSYKNPLGSDYLGSENYIISKGLVDEMKKVFNSNESASYYFNQADSCMEALNTDIFAVETTIKSYEKFQGLADAIYKFSNSKSATKIPDVDKKSLENLYMFANKSMENIIGRAGIGIKNGMRTIGNAIKRLMLAIANFFRGIFAKIQGFFRGMGKNKKSLTQLFNEAYVQAKSMPNFTVNVPNINGFDGGLLGFLNSSKGSAEKAVDEIESLYAELIRLEKKKLSNQHKMANEIKNTLNKRIFNKIDFESLKDSTNSPTQVASRIIYGTPNPTPGTITAFKYLDSAKKANIVSTNLSSIVDSINSNLIKLNSILSKFYNKIESDSVTITRFDNAEDKINSMNTLRESKELCKTVVKQSSVVIKIYKIISAAIYKAYSQIYKICIAVTDESVRDTYSTTHTRKGGHGPFGLFGKTTYKTTNVDNDY